MKQKYEELPFTGLLIENLKRFRILLEFSKEERTENE
jgi:hypothetical protein